MPRQEKRPGRRSIKLSSQFLRFRSPQRKFKSQMLHGRGQSPRFRHCHPQARLSTHPALRRRRVLGRWHLLRHLLGKRVRRHGTTLDQAFLPR